jgi:hypothetical protein
MPKRKQTKIDQFADFGSPERAAHGESVIQKTMTAGVNQRRYLSVWERIANSGDISEPAARAAERFNQDFQRASMAGRVALCSAERVDGGTGSQGEPDAIVAARRRVWEAYDAMPGELSKQALWWLIGVESSADEAVAQMKAAHINRHKLVGALYVTLDCLAKHYGFK